jgi:hypothetical protein
MSLVVDCEIGSLGLDDIFRMVSATDVDGNIYIRVYNDGTDPDTLSEFDCITAVSMLDILRGALVTNDDGEYALNVAALS